MFCKGLFDYYIAKTYIFSHNVCLLIKKIQSVNIYIYNINHQSVQEENTRKCHITHAHKMCCVLHESRLEEHFVHWFLMCITLLLWVCGP